jgi:hypothetical protein
MTNATTEHKIRQSTSPHHPTSREGQTAASTTIIEACDRLGQKLDEVASIMREQLQAWQQILQPAAPNSGARGIADNPALDPKAAPGPSVAQSAGSSQAGSPQFPPGQFDGRNAPDRAGGESAGAPGRNGTAQESVDRLIDTLTRDGTGWQEQAAGLQQALAAIMEYLEGQSVTPKVDVADIMNRLQNLEQEQQSLQSQFNNNRWGP